MAVSNKDIVTFDVSDEIIDCAKEIRRSRDEKYGNIFKEEATDMRYVGEIGEIIVNNALNLVLPEANEWHTDDVIKKPDFTFCNRDIDVKTVKRKVPIKSWYKAQITARHAKTPLDDLLFACYQFPVKKLHILGVMQKKEFLQKAEYFGEGQSVHENYTIRKGHEIYAITISEMTPFREYLKLERSKYRLMQKGVA